MLRSSSSPCAGVLTAAAGAPCSFRRFVAAALAAACEAVTALPFIVQRARPARAAPRRRTISSPFFTPFSGSSRSRAETNRARGSAKICPELLPVGVVQDFHLRPFEDLFERSVKLARCETSTAALRLLRRRPSSLLDPALSVLRAASPGSQRDTRECSSGS
jgi:hypothetical protein